MNLQVFSTLEQAQSTHGIPHQDYSQYRQYCTHRLARLRRVRDVKTHLVHNPRFVEGVSGRRHAYCPRQYYDDESKPIIQHENLFWDLFYQAERAWSQACELQQSSSSSTHAQRRLNKASKWAAELPVMARALQCDETTILEAESYAAWMKGNALLEKKNYLEAFRSYRASRKLLLQLAEAETDAQQLVLSDIWNTRAESVLRPLERYCHYEARNVLEPADLVDETSPSSGAVTSVDSIVCTFRGKDIALDHYKDLAVLYLRMEDALKTSHSIDDEDSFFQLFSDLDDALRLTQVELSRYEAMPDGPAVNARRADLRIMAAYFQYQKLSLWRHQQEKRAQGLTDHAEILHVYDALLQNARSMLELGDHDSNDSAQEDSHWLESQAHLIRIRAFRCFHLACWYEASPTDDAGPSEVLALVQHAKQLAQRAEEEIAACDDTIESVDIYLQDLEQLQNKIDTLICRVEASVFLQSTGTASRSVETDRPLWMRLDEMDSGPVLADRPPLPIAVPAKPVFYDIAWQYVGGDFPIEALEEYIAEHDEVAKEQAKKRSGGFFSGWFS